MPVTGIYTLVPSIPAYLFPYVGGIALVLGLLLAFFGESVFKMLTSIMGAMVGAVIGFAFGAALGGEIVAFIVAFIGAVVGGMLFYYVAEAGIALILGYFTYTSILYLLGAPGGVSNLSASLNFSEVIGLVAAFAVFMVSIIFFRDLVAILTSVTGGLMLDYGLTTFKFGTIATILSIVVIVLGMVYQFSKVRAKRQLKSATKHPISEIETAGSETVGAPEEAH